MVGRFYWLFIVFIIGCSSATKRLNTQLLNLYEEGKYQEALTLLEKSDLKKDKNNKLLYEMSRGILLFSLKDYQQASLAFKEAQDIIDRQETVSIRGKLSKEFLKEDQDVFYGSLVEQSYSFYYSTLSFLLQQKNDQINQQAIFAARASILAWNFFFSKLQNDELKTFYLRDLSQKMIGAKVHELVDTSEDRQISLALYKEARMIVVNEYKESAEISGEKKAALLRLIETKIFELTYRLRPGEIAGLKKEYKWVLEKPKTDEKKFTFLMQEGVISEKKAKTVDLSLRAAFDPKATGAQAALSAIGFVSFNIFAINVLRMPAGGLGSGVYFAGQNGGVYGAANGLVAVAAHEASLGFEVFEQPNKPSKNNYEIALYREDETLVSKADCVIIGAVGEMAQKIAQEDSAVRMIKAGSKFVLKHVLAMMGAYTIYQNFKSKDQASMGQFLALGSYVAGTKFISWLGEADTRYLSYLPKNVLMSEISVSPGKYRMRLVSKNDGKVLSDLGVKEIKNNNEIEFFQQK